MAELASQAVQILAEKTLNPSQKSSPNLAGPDFEKVLTQHLDKQAEMSRSIVDALGVGPDANKVKAISAEGLEIQPTQITSSNDQSQQHSKILNLLSEVNRGGLHMESLVDLMNSGMKLNPSQLLAMQASMSADMHMIDVASKSVEQLNSGIKHVLNTNVQ